MTTCVTRGATDLERLRQIVAAAGRVAPDSFGPDDDLPTMAGLDSLTLLRVVAAVEREFHVVIPDADLHEVRTLNGLARCIAANSSAARGGTSV